MSAVAINLFAHATQREQITMSTIDWLTNQRGMRDGTLQICFELIFLQDILAIIALEIIH